MTVPATWDTPAAEQQVTADARRRGQKAQWVADHTVPGTADHPVPDADPERLGQGHAVTGRDQADRPAEAVPVPQEEGVAAGGGGVRHGRRSEPGRARTVRM